MKIKIPNKISRATAKVALKASKHSPQALFVAGVVGFGATVVLAAQATLKLEDVLDDAREAAETLEFASTDPGYLEEHGPESLVKAKTYLKVRTAGRIVKLYLPALIIGSLSVAALTGSHRILTKRNAALTAAYSAIDKGFREYRARVVEDLGEEQDKKYRYGVEKVRTTEVDEDGKKRVVEKKVATGVSDYGRCFRDGNPNWTDRNEINFIFLRGIQVMANERLQAKGFVLLNDVYKDLGLEQTTAGSVVGWLWNGKGDGVIDFGILDNDLTMHDYLIGRENEIWLDFNVDGVIYDQIDKFRQES
jgi:hypothetical protein